MKGAAGPAALLLGICLGIAGAGAQSGTDPATRGPPLPPRRPAQAEPARPRPDTASLPTAEDRLDRPERRRGPARPGELKSGNVEPATPLPGRFAPEPTKLPSPFLKDKTVAPHTPDVQLDLSDRASLGAFGDVSQNPAKAENRIAPTPARPLQGLDMGAGVTLQYKFPTN